MILAHQGGWDEMLVVATPLVLVALLLVLANRRAQAQLDDELDRPLDDEDDRPG